LLFYTNTAVKGDTCRSITIIGKSIMTMQLYF
jgi:hypothetical protein